MRIRIEEEMRVGIVKKKANHIEGIREEESLEFG